MTYLELLRKAAKRSGSIACMGIDPVIDKIPLSGSTEIRLSKFFLNILDECLRKKVFPGAVKPNIAFFEQYGFNGLKALKQIVEGYRAEKIPVILDAKRGDIGKTSEAYARALFDEWEADAVTIAPYMGSDSVGPFLARCQEGRGAYILTRTSNKGAVDIQDLKDREGEPIYIKVARKIIEWHKEGIGSVVGATYPEELRKILKLYSDSGKEVCLLIPGVGAQGASAVDTMKILKGSSINPAIHRINSSSEISWAFEKKGSKDYAACAVDALAKLIEDTAI